MFERNTVVSRNPHLQRLVGKKRNDLSFRDAKVINSMYRCDGKYHLQSYTVKLCFVKTNSLNVPDDRTHVTPMCLKNWLSESSVIANFSISPL